MQAFSASRQAKMEEACFFNNAEPGGAAPAAYGFWRPEAQPGRLNPAQSGV